MHQYYGETIAVCAIANERLTKAAKSARLKAGESFEADENIDHNCHHPWAFALYKKGEIVSACKIIKQGVLLHPKDANNWVLWGLIMRTAGNYKSA